MTRSYRSKKEFKFWLYHDLLEDTRLMDYVDYLRKTHQFPKVIRNALRLMWTLGEGDLSVLFELFPSLRGQFMPKPDELIEQFRQMLQIRSVSVPELPAGPHQLELPLGLPPREAPPPPAHLHESMEQAIQEAVQAGIQKALNQLAKMQTAAGAPLLAEYSALNLDHSPMSGNPKSLSAPPIAMPTFDDEDTLIIRRDTSTKSDAVANFLAAASSFQERKED